MPNSTPTARAGRTRRTSTNTAPSTWKLGRMNLAIRGIDSSLGKEDADSFHRDLHPDLKADHVLTNPPFNDSYRCGAGPVDL